MIDPIESTRGPSLSVCPFHQPIVEPGLDGHFGQRVTSSQIDTLAPACPELAERRVADEKHAVAATILSEAGEVIAEHRLTGPGFDLDDGGLPCRGNFPK